MTYVGRKFAYRYDSGLETHGHFETATTMRWEARSGPAKGSTGVETISAAELTPGVFFISWVEKSGLTVSQVLDLHDMRVWSFVTFDTPGGRNGMPDKGTLTEIG